MRNGEERVRGILSDESAMSSLLEERGSFDGNFNEGHREPRIRRSEEEERESRRRVENVVPR